MRKHGAGCFHRFTCKNGKWTTELFKTLMFFPVNRRKHIKKTWKRHEMHPENLGWRVLWVHRESFFSCLRSSSASIWWLASRPVKNQPQWPKGCRSKTLGPNIGFSKKWGLGTVGVFNVWLKKLRIWGRKWWPFCWSQVWPWECHQLGNWSVCSFYPLVNKHNYGK